MPITLVWLLAVMEPVMSSIATVCSIHAQLLEHQDCSRLQQLRSGTSDVVLINSHAGRKMFNSCVASYSYQCYCLITFILSIFIV